jgi:hypothetical protein
MNTDTLAKLFWSKRLEHSFTCNDIAVYFALLDHCTALGGKNPFHFSALELQVKVGMKTKEPLNTARNRLKQAGLIDFKNGDGRGRTTQYSIYDPDAPAPAERGDKRGRKNTPLTPPLLSPLSSPLLPVENPSVRSSSLRSNNTTTTTMGDAAAVVGVGEGQARESTSPALAAEWQKSIVWMQVNAPRCLTLDLRLFTPDKLAALCATYTQRNVEEAMRAIHGESSAAKYACLATGLDKICRHRWPVLARGRPARVAPADIYGPDDAAVLAEQQEHQRREAEARNARRQQLAAG